MTSIEYICRVCPDIKKLQSKLETITAEHQKMKEIIKEADDYLESLHAINEISTGSILHKKFKSILQQIKEQ